MCRQQPSDDPLWGVDEHDQPTEPMAQVILSPFPKQRAGSMQPAGPFNRLPEAPPVYPVLPPAPAISQDGRPPGGVAPVQPATAPMGAIHTIPAEPRWSSIPIFVGVLFVAIQLLLLVRVILLLFGQPASVLWVGLIYGVSSVFAWPFHLGLEQIHLSLLAPGLLNYLAALLAILIYGLLSRFLVRFLKALLNSR